MKKIIILIIAMFAAINIKAESVTVIYNNHIITVSDGNIYSGWNNVFMGKLKAKASARKTANLEKEMQEDKEHQEERINALLKTIDKNWEGKQDTIQNTQETKVEPTTKTTIGIKRLIDGKVYIEKDGVLYDLLGKEIKKY